MNDTILIDDLIGAAYNTGYYSGRREDGQPHHLAAIEERGLLRDAALQRLADLRAALEALEAEADKMRRLLTEITPIFYITAVQEYMPSGQMDKVHEWLQSAAPDRGIQQARAALAATEETGDDS